MIRANLSQHVEAFHNALADAANASKKRSEKLGPQNGGRDGGGYGGGRDGGGRDGGGRDRWRSRCDRTSRPPP